MWPTNVPQQAAPEGTSSAWCGPPMTPWGAWQPMPPWGAWPPPSQGGQWPAPHPSMLPPPSLGGPPFAPHPSQATPAPQAAPPPSQDTPAPLVAQPKWAPQTRTGSGEDQRQGGPQTTYPHPTDFPEQAASAKSTRTPRKRGLTDSELQTKYAGTTSEGGSDYHLGRRTRRHHAPRTPRLHIRKATAPTEVWVQLSVVPGHTLSVNARRPRRLFTVADLLGTVQSQFAWRGYPRAQLSAHETQEEAILGAEDTALPPGTFLCELMAGVQPMAPIYIASQDVPMRKAPTEDPTNEDEPTDRIPPVSPGDPPAGTDAHKRDDQCQLGDPDPPIATPHNTFDASCGYPGEGPKTDCHETCPTKHTDAPPPPPASAVGWDGAHTRSRKGQVEAAGPARGGGSGVGGVSAAGATGRDAGARCSVGCCAGAATGAEAGGGGGSAVCSSGG